MCEFIKNKVALAVRLFGTVTRDPIVPDGFKRFETDFLSGLVEEIGDEIHILAIVSKYPGHGHFRRFIDNLQDVYAAITVWEIWNERLAETLKRYGFKHHAGPAPLTNERSQGMRWTGGENE